MFWTYSYIRICVVPNNLASYVFKRYCKFVSYCVCYYSYNDMYQIWLRRGQIICFTEILMLEVVQNNDRLEVYSDTFFYINASSH